MQKRSEATLFLITTYSIKILYQLKAAGYKRCSFPTLTPHSFSITGRRESAVSRGEVIGA